MIPKDCKRLAEVDFPIAEVSRHAAREKSIRHGHPSTLHLWWARRPLASSRAVLLGLLWPDPCDPLCPAEFKEQARKLLPQVGGCNPGSTEAELRKALLKFIADFANWDNAAQRTYLEVSRALVKAAHLPFGSQAAHEPPLVVDPFAGGGSIPLEALRLGCETFASDLNPVACLILKVMLEDIPRHGPTLAEDLRRVGAEIKAQAEKELADLYPRDPDGATPIAYLWARTARCESPNCGAEIPLLRSLWLCKKGNRRRALRYRVVRPAGEPPRVQFEVFEPKNENEVTAGTVKLANARCLACGSVLAKPRVRAQLMARHGGTNDARLLAVVTQVPGTTGRSYRPPCHKDFVVRSEAITRATAAAPFLPNEEIPTRHRRNSGFGVKLYGIQTWSDLFLARQRLFLLVLCRRIAQLSEGSPLQHLLAMVLSRCADYHSSLTTWIPSGEFIGHTFVRQSLAMLWDFAEAVPFADASGSYDGAVEWVARVVEAWPPQENAGQVDLVDACDHPLPDDSAPVWFSDPPYYDAIAYADLSDYFFVWLKRAMPKGRFSKDPFDAGNSLTPKLRECIANEERSVAGQPMDAHYFEDTVARAFMEGVRVVKDDGIGCVVFAHKTTEGWEAFLNAMTRAGWVVTASWPVATERRARLLAMETAALATSVHLVCRPRRADASIGDWAHVLRELPNRVGDWMERLQSEGVRGADLVFACIGPALEIFSRYTKVETAEGREVALAEYLEKVWEVVGRSALAQVLGTAEAKARNGAAGAVEEDARLTALFLWTLQSTGGEADDSASDVGEDAEPSDEDDNEGSFHGKAKGFTLVFDVVRRFAQPLGIELPKWEGRVIETKKGVVRLLPITERAKQLFGEDGAQAVATRLEEEAAIGVRPQLTLFPDELPAAPTIRGRGRGRTTRSNIEVSDENLAATREATTLDRVHAAMLLQAGGRTNALRALLRAEQDRGPDFLRLANALSALYPKGSEEKRLLDAMLLAVPR
jgi:putative DNA methylase